MHIDSFSIYRTEDKAAKVGELSYVLGSYGRHELVTAFGPKHIEKT